MSKNKFELPSEVKEYFGIDSELESFDQFKEIVSSKLVPKENVPDEKAITGKLFKNVGQNIRKGFIADHGLEVPNSELENTPTLEEFVFTNVSKIKNTYETKIKELQSQITEPNEALNKIKSDFDKVNRLLKEEKEASQLKDSAFMQKEEQYNGAIKKIQKDFLKEKGFSKIKFKQDISDVERVGFDNIIDSKYVIDFDENGSPLITDKEGKRIPNPKVVGAYKTPFEIFEEEAIANKLVITNPHTDTKQPVNKKEYSPENKTTVSSNGKMNFFRPQ